MTKSFAARWVAFLAATSMLTVPVGGQQTTQAPPSQPTTGASSPQTSGSPSGSPSGAPTPASTSTSTAGETGAATSSTPATSTAGSNPPTMPGVKPGSKDDVNAIGNRNVGKGLDFYSLDHEIALGKQLSQEVEKSAKFIYDPVIVEYVNRVGQNIVRNSDAQVPLRRIKVIDSDVVNAFALPGGFFLCE